MNDNIKNLLSQITTDVSGEWVSVHQVEKLVNIVVDRCANIVNDLSQHEGPGLCSMAKSLKDNFQVKQTVIPIQPHPRTEHHICPYRAELFNDYTTLCDCDGEETRNCAMDV